MLAFPGIFRGALDSGAPAITEGMKLAAARAIAALVPQPTADEIVPSVFDERVARRRRGGGQARARGPAVRRSSAAVPVG